MRKLFCFTLAAAAALGLGGCGSDNEGGGGSGAAFAYAPPPTARPTLAGMAPLADLSGGNGTAGNAAGGNGGTVGLRSTAGALLEGAAQAPGIDNNVISAASLADNVVTFAELMADAGPMGAQTGTDAWLDLVGRDLWVPDGATLDLSGAPASLDLRLHGPGDVLRVDGTVITTRAAAAPVGWIIRSFTAPGVAVSLDGSIQGIGTANQNGGLFAVIAHTGHISAGGTFLLRGGDGATAGNGGQLQLIAVNGNLYLHTGLVTANGGSGTGTGGNGGTINITGGGPATRLALGLRANGGAAATGDAGSGGTIVMRLGGLDAFVPAELHGGASTGANGGNGGQLQVQVSTLTGVIALAGNGGQAAANGGLGALLLIEATTHCFSFAGELVAHGGQGDFGGGGGFIRTPLLSTTAPQLGPMDQVLLHTIARGGQGTTTGGNGGAVVVRDVDTMRGLTLRGEVNGGDSPAGSPGTGGAAGVVQTAYGSHSNSVVIEIQAIGGSTTTGTTGGAGGGCGIAVQPRFLYGTLQAEISGDCSGGQGALAGGAGGTLAIGADLLATVDASLDITLHGGAATNGSGGAGGSLEVLPLMATFVEKVSLSGSVQARGGPGGGATGEGGLGGSALLQCGGSGHLVLNGLNLDLRGGDSPNADGGPGGTIQGDFEAPVWVTGGSFDTSGGAGADSGGLGGDQNWIADSTPLDFRGATFRARGGNGDNSGHDGGIIAISTCVGDDIGAPLWFDATGDVTGGASSAGSGGQGGELILTGRNLVTGFAHAARLQVRGAISADGGTGATAGGDGGNIELRCDGIGIDVNATLRTDGGAGAAGGNGGTLLVDGDDGSALGYAAVTLRGLAASRGGAGGGSGGSITIGGAGADVTLHGTLDAGGAATGGDGGGISIGQNTSATVTLSATAVVRANGAATAGLAGTVALNPAGTGPANANLVEQAGSVVQTLDGSGTAQPNITRD